ncbi:MAG TPA: hypothetical protein VF921_19025 [Vicinamibacterales bacterium]
MTEGDDTALADGEPELTSPLLLLTEPPELATLPPPPPRSTAPPLLAAPLPLDRSAAPAAAPPPPLSDGLWANAGAVASVKLATTIPTRISKALMCAPLPMPSREGLALAP